MDKVFTLSFAQERLFFVDQILPKKSLFNIPIILHLTGNLDISCLQKALDELLIRHEILRLRIQQVDGVLQGIIVENKTTNLEVIDFRDAQESIGIREALNYINQKASEEFNLLDSELIKTHLLLLDGNKFILSIILHHIITDEWSIDILLSDLNAIYQAKKEGVKHNLPDFVVQYSDYALIQRNQINNNFFDNDLKYWKHYLDSAPPVLFLPNTKSRPAELTYLGGNYKIKLPLSQLLKIKNYATSKRVTMFTLLLALFKCFLYRYTEEKDIVIGYPAANRLQQTTENLIGLFVNLVPIRSIFRDNLNFENFLNEIKLNLIDSYEHQGLPFDRLVQNLGINRRTNYHPIFQILFTLYGKHSGQGVFKEFNLELIELEANLAKFDLSLFCKEELDGLSIKASYSRDLFDDSTIKTLVNTFVNITNIILENDQLPIDKIPLVTSLQKSQLLAELTKKIDCYPCQDLRLHTMFTNQAKLTPDNLAIITTDSQYSYKELDILSDKFANYLFSQGIIPYDKIIINLNPSFELIICLLGILKVGATYIPIATDCPQARIEQILTNSETSLVITNSIFIEKFSTYNLKIIYLDQDWHNILVQTEYFSQVSNNEIACIMYTSGSTGSPKGVLYKHSSICNRAIWISRTYPFSLNETGIVLSSITFVDFITELFMPLLSGIKVVVTNSYINRNPDLLISYLNKYMISRINLTPSLLKLILEQYADLPSLLPCLKHWEISGELFQENLIILTLKKLGQVRLINRYGSTEATSVIYNELTLGTADKILLNTKIIANTYILVLDKFTHLLPKGVVGEIGIMGAALAKGYFNDPELTSRNFSKCSFKLDDQTIYKTGDLGYLTQEGNIVITGRKDSQIKFNGYRMEPNEIALIMENHILVKQAIVINRKDINGTNKLIAYFTSMDKNNLDLTNELFAYLKRHLPDYMIPSHLIPLDTSPLGASGKIDYQQLYKNSDDISYSLQKEYVPPTTQLENELVKIWKEILKLDKVGINDNFFRIGGHSLLLIKLIATIKNQLNINLSVNFFYENPTIKDIINLENETLQDNKTTLTAFYERSEYQSLLLNSNHAYTKIPLIANRYSYFFKRKRNLEFWNIRVVFKLEFINKNALVKAASALVEHHEELRLQLSFTDNEWQQFIVQPSKIKPIIFHSCPFSFKSDNFKLFVENHVNNLQNAFTFPGELFKILVLESADQNFILAFVIHHLLSDEFSTRIIIKDFFTLYDTNKKGQQYLIPSKTLSLANYSSYSTFYWNNLANEVVSYWRSLPWQNVKNVPIDYPQENSYNIEEFTTLLIRTIPAKNFGSNRKHANKFNVLEILLCAIGLAYHDWTKQDILSINLLFLGREIFTKEIDLSRTVGCICEFIPILLQPTLSLQDFLTNTQIQIEKANMIGKSFGVMKYLADNQDIINEFSQYLEPQISLNFLLNFMEDDNELQALPNLEKDYNFLRDKPDTERAFLISGGAFFRNQMFHLSWDFSSKIFNEDTIDNFTNQCLKEFVKLSKLFNIPIN